MNSVLTKFNKNLRRFLPTLLDNSAVLLLRKKAYRGPLFVSWDITDRCNAKCIMCGRWQKQIGEELSKETKMKIIEDLAYSGVWLLSICGGEPFLDPGLKDLLLLARANGLLINVTTNGSLIMENLDLIEHLDFLTVSVDSAVGSVHDQFRGFPGLFDRISQGLNAACLLKKKPEIYIRCIVGKANAASLDSYIRYWKDKVDGIVFQPIHHSPGIHFQAAPEFMHCGLPEEAIFKKFILSLKKSGLLNIYNKGIPDFLLHQEEMSRRFHCYSGYFSLEIDSAGNLWNCAEHKHKLGNLAQQNLLQLMNADREGLRKINNDQNCICYHNCAMISIYLSDFINFFKANL